MHFLDRSKVPAPECLAKFVGGKHRWEDLEFEHREEIRSRLEGLQEGFCAYCEGSLAELGRHIEHLWRRSHHPHRTFDWTNLFLSCTRRDSCGKHKDECDHEAQDLIDPGHEDPERYFRFLSNGSIAIKSGLTDREAFRARETLRAFNLDARFGRLRAMRAAVLKGYEQTLDDLREYAEHLPSSDWLPFLHEELELARKLPFATAIRHVLVESTS